MIFFFAFICGVCCFVFWYLERFVLLYNVYVMLPPLDNTLSCPFLRYYLLVHYYEKE